MALKSCVATYAHLNIIIYINVSVRRGNRTRLGRSETALGPRCEIVHLRHVEHPGLHHQLAVYCDLHAQTGRLFTGRPNTRLYIKYTWFI